MPKKHDGLMEFLLIGGIIKASSPLYRTEYPRSPKELFTNYLLSLPENEATSLMQKAVGECPIEVLSVEEVPEHQGNIKRKALVERLLKLGFVQYMPQEPGFAYMLAYTNTKSTLYFLFSSKGICIKYFDTPKSIEVDRLGRVEIKGGKTVWNYYQDSYINLHDLCAEIAQAFVNDTLPRTDQLIPHGITPSECNDMKDITQIINKHILQYKREI
ncbi:hypothetical protein [Litorilituus lipolyticus]|uniref:Uncharacterized protein n=1 Tax=Litorilituus lipolyticus TaxID=2491017 RepID=A0A502L6D6_9GAMM|nr:hypothetical protein [Litorilituus lipolyticus]TPH18489.1 hypothetical protein EPA86_01610 [Litorilituus lipolyticus]